MQDFKSEKDIIQYFEQKAQADIQFSLDIRSFIQTNSGQLFLQGIKELAMKRYDLANPPKQFEVGYREAYRRMLDAMLSTLPENQA